LVHHIALKPILFGTIAAKLVGVKSVVNAPVGMGFLFSSDSSLAGLFQPIIRLFLKIVLNPKGSCTVLENHDDLTMLSKLGAIRSDRVVLIRGAGVDINRFFPQPFPAGRCRVLLLARMLRDKGVHEFVAAARRLKAKGIEADFLLAGSPDPGNPTTISERELLAWHAEGIVQWLGHQENVSTIINQSHIVCLPSYREGLPKSLIEAMACGRPIVTTDVPGCREAVRHGENGVLVPAKNIDELTKALESLIVEPSLRMSMGTRGRERAEKEFSSEIVCAETSRLYKKMAFGLD
jgi:glycosyltransferase involved in cell wall biosynthesis